MATQIDFSEVNETNIVGLTFTDGRQSSTVKKVISFYKDWKAPYHIYCEFTNTSGEYCYAKTDVDGLTIEDRNTPNKDDGPDTLEKFEIERRINMTNGTTKVFIRCSNAVGGTQCRVMCYQSQRNWTYAVQIYGPDFPMAWSSAIEAFIIDWFHVHVGPDNRVPQLMHTCRENKNRPEY